MGCGEGGQGPQRAGSGESSVRRLSGRFRGACIVYCPPHPGAGDRRSGLANTQAGDDKGVFEAVEAAERAGSVVSEQIRSIMEAAQAKADEIERHAQDEAERSRRESADAATRLLEQIDEMEGHLSGLVQSLRREADQLSVSLQRSARD